MDYLGLSIKSFLLLFPLKCGLSRHNKAMTDTADARKRRRRRREKTTLPGFCPESQLTTTLFNISTYVYKIFNGTDGGPARHPSENGELFGIRTVFVM